MDLVFCQSLRKDRVNASGTYKYLLAEGGCFGSEEWGKTVLDRYSAPLHKIVKWRSAPKRLATVPNNLTYFLKGYSPLSNEAPLWQGDSRWHRLRHSCSTTDSPESLYEWIPSQAFVRISPQGTRTCERLSSIPRTNTQSTFTDCTLQPCLA